MILEKRKYLYGKGENENEYIGKLKRDVESLYSEKMKSTYARYEVIKEKSDSKLRLLESRQVNSFFFT